MSDIYVPGLKSRFDTNKIVDDLMKIERIPKERSEKNIENLQAQKSYWQDLGRRITAFRDSARFLYSFQNPFNERVANSSDSAALSATATREAGEQEYSFTVKQIAKADKFLSDPLDDSFKIDEGTYTFAIGQETVTFPFKGGSLREFSDTINRRGRGKLTSSLIAVQPGKKSLLIESKITGAENKLQFLDAAENLGVQAGILGEKTGDTTIKADALQVKAGETAFIPLDIQKSPSRNALLQFEIATEVHTEPAKPAPEEKPAAEEPAAKSASEEKPEVEQRPPAESAPGQIAQVPTPSAAIAAASAMAATASKAVAEAVAAAKALIAAAMGETPEAEKTPEETAKDDSPQEELAETEQPKETEIEIAEEPAETEQKVAAAEAEKPPSVPSANVPAWTPLTDSAKRVDTMQVLYLTFADGSSRSLPPIKDSDDFSSYQYRLFDVAGEKSIVSLEIVNQNTHRAVSIRNIRLHNPEAATDGIGALKPISEAQDAIITMEGIEISRPTNAISDLIPGVTLNAKAPSNSPISLKIEPDRENIKDAVITFVANYNRLVADINVLTRNDDKVVQELTYLSADEQADLRKRMGAFAGDSILGQFRSTLQRVAAAPYMTAEQDVAMLAQIGIGTDVRGSGGSGYDPARLRGYLEIDEKALDNALETNLNGVRQLFGYDSDGDYVVDSGVAYTLESLAKPYTEIGGIIALKTGSIDSRVAQENRRIETLDRQLAAKEAALKSQYGQMEGAYNRMERMNSSLDQFSQQNSK
ncbi:MAG: flagellar filament capping protein FliD [Spirochaetaceae bacterium]|jgi:flagellar hook-associated protein 2|nr:flagellar filament capping protein FliD [Spirochaetaceae bacterium]